MLIVVMLGCCRHISSVGAPLSILGGRQRQGRKATAIISFDVIQLNSSQPRCPFAVVSPTPAVTSHSQQTHIELRRRSPDDPKPAKDNTLSGVPEERRWVLLLDNSGGDGCRPEIAARGWGWTRSSSTHKLRYTRFF